MSHVGEQILLGAAWCHEDEVRLFELHPEVFMFNVTMQTNCERWPLGIGTEVDQNMNVFTPIRVFMLAQHSWVMEWIFCTCLPTLLGKESLSRMQLVLTDGDKQMHGAFDNNQADFCPRQGPAWTLHAPSDKQGIRTLEVQNSQARQETSQRHPPHLQDCLLCLVSGGRSGFTGGTPCVRKKLTRQQWQGQQLQGAEELRLIFST